MLDHWHSRSLNFLEPYLSQLQLSLSIATGFFTVEGYDLLRAYLQHKKIRILVGYDETSHQRVKDRLVDEIKQYLSSWSAENRRAAVLDLVAKLKAGEFQLAEQPGEFIETRLRFRDHGKVYIFDEKIAVTGSANLTRNGLLHNTENLTAVDDLQRVWYWSQTFTEYWNHPRTQDLTALLLEMLLNWLKLSNPFDIYLKTIQALSLLEEDDQVSPQYKQPVLYQRVVIQRSLEQLKKYRGSIIVASTGLGKTIMATDIARRLHKEKAIFNVVIYAPAQVKSEWETAFRSAGIYADFRTRNNLDQPVRNTRTRGKVDEAVQSLDNANEYTLIILDETQYFVNRLSASSDGERRSFERLQKAIASNKPYVLMLTATPRVKEVGDLNNQLMLLPHTAPLDTPTQSGQQHLFPPLNGANGRPWSVVDNDGYFEDFLGLPVATVISTAYVAKTYAHHTLEGDYLEFGEHKRWIPQVELFKVNVPALFEDEIGDAINEGYFKHKSMSFQTRGQWRRSETTIELQALKSWTSSPAALQDVIEQTIGDGQDLYQAEFIFEEEERRRRLRPILDMIKGLKPTDDPKILQLCNWLQLESRQGRKVIIFAERLPTCVYLEEAIRELLPDLKVATAVERDKIGHYIQKPAEEVESLIIDFAPEANKDKVPRVHTPQQIDVFILTDAYGVGVNLQDASVVINYDLAWTPDTLIQRAGRVMRFWKEPRRVKFYVFVNQFSRQSTGLDFVSRIEQRLRNLVARSQHAERFSELPMIPSADTALFQSLAPLSAVQIESVGVMDAGKVEEFIHVSPFLLHLTVLSQNEEYAKTLPDDISSAMTYQGSTPKLFLLVRFQSSYETVLYDMHSERLEYLPKEALLNLLQCEITTPVALIDADFIEIAAQHCKRLWCESQGISEMDHVERVCALYLHPTRSPDM